MPPVKEIEEGDGNVAAASTNTEFIPDDEKTSRTPSFSSYLDWWYRSSTEWVLWYVIASKQSDIVDARPSPSRIDSGIAFNAPEYPVQAAHPDPLTFTFHLDDRTYTKTLDYRTFARWEGIGALLDELRDDGIMTEQLWDVDEAMEVGSGDWEARVRPGWNVEVWCQHVDLYERTSDCVSELDSDSDEDEEESESEGRCEQISKCERRWWFARWKDRVEKKKTRKERAHQEPSWIMMLIWATCMLAFIGIISVLAT
jgi:hypothetical protein